MATYQPYLIANFATGQDESRQPWLNPDDSQQELLDGFIYRGQWEKREGYGYFADGQRGSAPYCESRIVHNVVDEAYGTGSGIAGPYTHTAANIPLRRGTITITAGAQSATDDGLGSFTTSPAGGSGTVDYTNGQMSITYNASVAGATPITVTYDYHPGNPVMMVASFYTATNTEQLIVCDTEFVNKYNSVTNRLDDISPASAYTGNNSNFFSWTNYRNASDSPRLIFSNYVDNIQSYDGSTVTDYVYTPPSVGVVLKCLLLFSFKDRLVLLNITESGTRYPLRIRISGTGSSCDDFSSAATGAGVIDIPDYGAIQGAALNRDDLIIFTTSSTWILKYTGNDVVPFTLERLDPTRGSAAPFSAISYLNLTTTVSQTGFIGCDGYRVQRIDDKIPDYSYNKIDQDNINLCYSGSVDDDRDHYLIHPTPGETESDRILVRNYEESNYCVYRIPLSCMGNFLSSFDVTWNDLLIFDNWDQMAEQYGSWYDFAYTKGTPISIAGGHHGEIWEIGSQETIDNPIKVRGVSVSGNIATITTDFQNYQIGSYVFFSGLEGSTEINNKQLAILSVPTNYTFTVDITTIGSISAYTSGGVVATTIPFESLTKKFNPFVAQAAKVRCGWMYFYVSTTGTDLTDSIGDPVSPKIFVDVIVNDTETNTSVQNAYLQEIQNPYQVNCVEDDTGRGIKRWYKIFINQTGKFIQFRFRNDQAGANIKIQAIMPGFQPVGRLI